MNTILTKLKDFVGITEPDEYDDYEEWEQYPHNEPEEPDGIAEQEPQSRRRNREPINLTTETVMGSSTRSNVIGMPGITNGIAEVVVIEPHSFEEMPQVIQTLRERKSVVLNLNAMNPAEAQRAVDFVAGGTYAIDGHQERIGESIFLFTPNCVKVSTLSGTVHDVAEMPKASPRPASPTPAWGAEVNRIAQ
ncbi:cell division protein SepF [Hydrococcus rivularis NIES-593]|uniref:Cell division protein SepF n=1 Tax=Hydrococcus rivularis NIES-593 TaxID=1921803 RepID=A0A1U7HDE9_9CYAN|nr:cell division protein SepF [Hydrococcus rivularis]OKH21622.1 cell division protein SepF [Hydrococcus rivularis NIES-593]